jgi:hypothetical protein
MIVEQQKKKNDIFEDTGFSTKNIENVLSKGTTEEGEKVLSKGITKEIEENFRSYFSMVHLSHKGLIAIALMECLDKLWNEPLKNPNDVDSIVEHWRYQVKRYLNKKEDENG